MTVINFVANGKSLRGHAGQTVLDALLENGIEVPHLCQMAEMNPYGGCSLCLVEIAGMAKPVRSCATMLGEGMEILSKSARLTAARKHTLELMLSDHLGDCRPPCRNRCPAHNDCQGYIGLIASGQFAEAIRIIKEDNPLPGCIGRVCPHPCETVCRRGLVEAPLSIAHLKQAAADVDLATGKPYRPSVAPETGKRVAVIGAGPAGLSAAYFLRRRGHAVEIFEAMEAPGGMLRYGIPAYRLPKHVIDTEVGLIEDLGVTIHYNQKLGREIDLNKLSREYDAVFVAVGAWQSSNLGCKRDDLPGVFGGIDMLEAVAKGEAPALGDRVAVVGGGNTAIDAARTAVRLGAKEVTLIYRRSREEMPAEPWEVAEAEEEGVRFRFLATPQEVLEQNGRACGLRLQKMRLGEPDKSGRRRPEPIEGALEDVPFDSVIAAIGQKIRPDGLDALELTPKGTIKAAKGTYQTNLDNVFAGGDAINDGPGIAISAISHGKFAAQAMDGFLRGEMRPVVEPFLVEREDFSKENLPPLPEVPRVETTFLPVKERITDFREIALTYTPEEAMAEASRCLECGCCDYYDCQLLPLLQKYGVEKQRYVGVTHKIEKDFSNPLIWRDGNKCVLCEQCVRICREKVGVGALASEGRGFFATTMPAFELPLAESSCISCGECAQYCPTGAIQERHAFAKTPPLPIDKVTATCGYCSKACQMELHYFGNRLLKVYPLDNTRSCSLGRFGLVLANDAKNGCLPQLDAEQEAALLRTVLGYMEYWEGKKPQFKNVAQLVDFLCEG